jgi:hypothetical protein
MQDIRYEEFAELGPLSPSEIAYSFAGAVSLVGAALLLVHVVLPVAML